MRGRTPKPTALKLLEGNPGRRPLNKSEPTPDALTTRHRPPAYLDDEARKVWKVAVSEMPPGILTKVDQEVLATYCQACADIRHLRELLREQGEVVETAVGVKRNPARVSLEGAQRTMITAAARLGFSPSDRTKLQVPLATEKSPLEELRDKMRKKRAG